MQTPSRTRLTLAYAAIYFIWGSSYLLTRVAVSTLPPFLMFGLRQLLAGSLLFAWLRLRGEPAPTLKQWKGAAILSLALLVFGGSIAAWALQYVESGLAALIMACVPMFTVVMERKPLSAARLAALLLGLAGVAVLIWPKLAQGGSQAWGVVAVFASAAAWSWGGLAARRLGAGTGSRLQGAMQMVVAAVVVLPFALPAEWGAFHPAQSSRASWTALACLIVLNSWVAYGAFQWLLRVQPPMKVATYAYVNPIVAVWLGWWLLDEPLSPRILASTACVALSVAWLLKEES